MLHTCHDVLHDSYNVGGLAERGGVVVFILKQREGREAGWEKGKMVKWLQKSGTGMLLASCISRCDQLKTSAWRRCS